jgi:hypothetical protein
MRIADQVVGVVGQARALDQTQRSAVEECE